MPQSLFVNVIDNNDNYENERYSPRYEGLQRGLIENTKHAFYLLVLGVRKCSMTVDICHLSI